MTLEDLGFDPKLYSTGQNSVPGFEIGRVVAEHRERYIVKTAGHDLEAEITGNLRFTAKSREDFPVVGDWVALSVFDKDSAIIHKILPRFTLIKRQSPGSFGDVQPIAANIDLAFLVQSAGYDFNLNRLERYLAICYASGVKPVILISKADLFSSDEMAELVVKINARIKDVPVVVFSSENRQGLEKIDEFLLKGKTCCLLGSSGVGKSTLLNRLSGKAAMQTGAISESTGKGRHVTSHRELIVLENGAILIDNPGMREVGIADSGGLANAFDRIVEFAKNCRFDNCTHTVEAGCAVIHAVQRGEIENQLWENFVKMQKETERFDLSLAEKRKKDRDQGKLFKNLKKDFKKSHPKYKS